MKIALDLHTEEEAQILLNILNIATKAAGLEVAEPCVVLAKRLTEAVQAAKTEKPAPDLHVVPKEPAA